MSIFDAIVQAAPDSISAEELASKRGADPILVGVCTNAPFSCLINY